MIDFHFPCPTWNLRTSSAGLEPRVRVRGSINYHAEWMKMEEWKIVVTHLHSDSQFPLLVMQWSEGTFFCVWLGVTGLITEYSQVTFSLTLSQNNYYKLCVLKSRESQHQESQSVNSAFTMKLWLTDCHLWTLPLTWRRGCGLLSCLAYLCCQWHTSKTQMRK